ncbi:hypothetical protein GCM10010277_58530 [Streptomyces longisporoflavus]|nr:hypothetical protein GCM10010277_58530 [Streptomyces longisporoflavus]
MSRRHSGQFLRRDDMEGADDMDDMPSAYEKTPSALRFRKTGEGLLRVAAPGFEPGKAEPHRLGCCLETSRWCGALRGNDVNDTRYTGVLRHPIDQRPARRRWLGFADAARDRRPCTS